MTYGITVCNEKKEIKRLLDTLLPLISKNDEVVVLQDITHEDQDVTAILTSYDSITVLRKKLNGDFATFKNHLIKVASKDYLFQIDADEMPTKHLLDNVKVFLSRKRKVDAFGVPRANIVNGIDESYIKKWNWTQNDKGYINFPDYQMRIFKLSNKQIKWVNKVHEELIGYTKIMNLPIDTYAYCLLHEKDIVKQVAQNKYYDQEFGS